MCGDIEGKKLMRPSFFDSFDSDRWRSLEFVMQEKILMRIFLQMSSREEIPLNIQSVPQT